MSDQTLPTDHFSRRLRELTDNPGAVRSTSTIQTADFYGNAESWIVDTFRLDAREEVFLQRISADAPIRIVLPPAVTAAIARQRDRGVTVVRRRTARSTMAARVARGDDPTAALRKHRKGGSRG